MATCLSDICLYSVLQEAFFIEIFSIPLSASTPKSDNSWLG